MRTTASPPRHGVPRRGSACCLSAHCQTVATSCPPVFFPWCSQNERTSLRKADRGGSCGWPRSSGHAAGCCGNPAASAEPVARGLAADAGFSAVQALMTSNRTHTLPQSSQ
eukprot:1406558-Rhodomonas_salina.1